MSKLSENWATATVEDVAEIRSGNGFPINYQGRTEGELPFFKVGDISRNWQKGQITLTKAEHYLTRKESKEIHAKTLPEGSVVFAKIGAAVALNRRAILGTEALVDNNVMGLVPSESTTSRFLFYFMCQVDLGAATRGGAVPSLRKADVGTLRLPLPPLPEQCRIVARIEELFSRLDAGVAALRHAKAQLQRYRQSVLAAAVTGQLTQAWREKHPETEPASELLKRILKQRREQWNGKAEYKEPLSADAATLYQLPVSWRWSLIGEAFNVYVGATPSRKEPAYWGGEIPWISSGEVAFCRIRATKETITERGLANTSTTVHKPGTILVGMIGEGKTRGQTAILDINACHNQNSAAIRVSETEVLPEYVYYFLTYRYEETRKEGSGGNQPALNKSRIQAIPIPLPPLAEQHQIVAEVEARTTAIDHLEAELNRQIARSTRLRQSTLATAFSGKF